MSTMTVEKLRDEVALCAYRIRLDGTVNVHCDLLREVHSFLNAYLAAREADAVPVAVVGDAFTLHWIGAGPIAPLIERHGIKKGDKLYAAPVAQEAAAPAEQVVGDGVDIANEIRGSIIRRLNDFHKSNPSSWCGYLDDALGAAEVIAESLRGRHLTRNK